MWIENEAIYSELIHFSSQPVFPRCLIDRIAYAISGAISVTLSVEHVMERFMEHGRISVEQSSWGCGTETLSQAPTPAHPHLA